MKKRVIQSALIILLTVAVLIVVLLSFQRYMDTLIRGLNDGAIAYLEEISRLNAMHFRSRVEDNLLTLSSFSTLVAETREENAVSLLAPLQEGIGPDMQYLRLGIVTPDGRVYTTDRNSAETSYQRYFLEAMEGRAIVSARLFDSYLETEVNVYCVPIYQEDVVDGVLFAVVSNEDFQALLPTPFTKLQGFSAVAEKDGRNVAGTLLSNAPGEDTSVFDASFASPEEGRRILKDFQRDGTGTVRYLQDGAEWYVSYTPLGINDWYLLTSTPVGATVEYADRMILGAWITWSIITLVLIALLVTLHVQRSLRIRAYTRYLSTDEETGIRNWHSFSRAAKEMLQAHPPASYVFIRMEVGRYQAFQDFFGEDVGQAFLRDMAQILEQGLWSTELCAHYVDGIFVLLLHDQPPNLITQRLHAWIDDISRLQPNYSLHFSCGVVEVERSDVQLPTLYVQAKYAVRHIVELHDTHIRFFDAEHKKAMLMKTTLEQNMYGAIQQEQFVVYFQPKYSLSQGRYAGAEALVRWNHPEYGLLSPDAFIPFFEKNGFITTLDLYMVEHVCALLHQWRLEGRQLLPVSVNLSKLNMIKGGIVTTLLDIVHRHELSPTLIEIELTESAFVDALPKFIEVIAQLHEAGFTVAMDDFGTGYSSLGLLRRAPVDVIKLDRTFFCCDDDHERQQIILRNVIRMIDELSIQTLSEGIETDDQVRMVQALGCDLIQSYRFGKPMPAGDFARLLEENASREGT